MKRLFVIILSLGVLGTARAADSPKELSHQYDMVFQQFLREKIVKFHRNIPVEIFLKDKTVVKGTFENFVEYDDTVWIMPAGKHGLFSDDAYDISDLQDVKVIVSRGI